MSRAGRLCGVIAAVSLSASLAACGGDGTSSSTTASAAAGGGGQRGAAFASFQKCMAGQGVTVKVPTFRGRSGGATGPGGFRGRRGTSGPQGAPPAGATGPGGRRFPRGASGPGGPGFPGGATGRRGAGGGFLGLDTSDPKVLKALTACQGQLPQGGPGGGPGGPPGGGAAPAPPAS